MRKRILFTVTNDLTYDQRMIRICTSLAKANYEVTLIGRHRKKSKAFIPQPFQQKRLSCFSDKGKLFYIEYNIRLFLFLLFSKFDVVCSIDLDTILAGYYVSKWKGKKCIYDAHEYFTEVPEVVNRPKVKAVWERVAKATIPNLSHCYTVCESLSNVFKEQYGTDFEVIRNVPFKKVETDAKEAYPIQKINAHNKVLLYQGVLNDGRGIEELFHSLQSINGVELWLAGEGDLSDALRQLAKQLKLENKVQFLGYVQPHQLKSITCQADIGLNLLQNKGLNYYYSLANKAFDYIQEGIPAIHMNFPEYQALNKEIPCSLLIDDLKPATIQKAIEELITDEELYQSLQSNCTKGAVHWNWEKEELKLLNFYEELFRKWV